MFEYTFQWRQAFRALPQMLEGALVTMQISLLSMVLGITIAVLLALGRNSKSIWLRGPATAWVEVARNTPALFQIYMAHFGLGSFGIYLSPFVALLAGITFNNAGYLCETFRGALRAIPDTQTRAGRSLGMGQAKAFRLIIAPQMFRASRFCRRQTRWSGPF